MNSNVLTSIMQKVPVAAKVLSLISFGVLVASVWLYIAFPLLSHTEDEQTLTITTNLFAGNFLIIAAVAWVASIVACGVSLYYKLWLGLLSLASVVIAPVVLFISFISIVVQYDDAAKIQDESGNEYHLLMSHFMQGSSLYIAKVIDKRGNTITFQKLAFSPWEESFGCLAIVRPEGAAKSPGLYLNANQMLMGIPYGNTAYFAYDLKNKVPYSYGDDRKWKNIQTLSPFLLIGKDDKPNEEDFKAYMERKELGTAKLDVIRTELKNPNKRVREMAHRILYDPIKKAKD